MFINGYCSDNACRAGTTTPFHCGPRITTDQANFDGRGTYNGSLQGQFREQTVALGSFPPNAFELHDMHGNVWEWCQDAWHGSYGGAPTDGSAWEAEGKVARVLRGGSWLYFQLYARCAYRFWDNPFYRINLFGFRVVCSPHR